MKSDRNFWGLRNGFFFRTATFINPKVMFSFSRVTVARERKFEQDNVRKKRAGYLKSNPLVRYREDSVYRGKVDQLREGLEKLADPKPSRWILDLGGNTGGETTVLSQEGFRMVLSDINEVALEVARARAKMFNLQAPHCVAADVHALPFADETFQAVMVIEALHHFDNYDEALGEIFRTLEPGGGLLALEPNGWNPLRRLSEIRDRCRGTIEKSFTRGQLQRLLRRAGFVGIEIVSVPSGRSALRMGDVPFYRRGLARFHAWLQQTHPRFFGAYQIHALKPGEPSGEPPAWPDFLRTPGGQQEVRIDGTVWRAGKFSYPDYENVPVLIEADRSDDDS
jgi:ubiquinone/menaquinone biosynthesis C-methylase UbiE